MAAETAAARHREPANTSSHARLLKAQPVPVPWRLRQWHQLGREPLYSDDCCEVHPDCVKIFWYFFPFAGTKTVQVSQPEVHTPNTRN